jgi:hypothetical protein
MNAAAVPMNNTTFAMGGMAKPLIGVVLFILFVVGLYYLYNFLYGTNASYGMVDLLSDVRSTTKVSQIGTTGNNAVAATTLTGLLDGGQYSTSFWVYVADTKGTTGVNTKLVHLMEISKDRFATTQTDRGNTLLFVGLNPINGTLVVRQSASDTPRMENKLTGMSGTSFPLDSLINDYNTTNSSYKQDDRCDILNGIEYQRWLLVTVVANGRTLDVYVDGKLARSCVYSSNFALGSSNGNATAYFGLNNNQALKGFLSGGKFYNYALTPDAIWSLYQAGPTGYFTIGSFFSNLFNVNVGFGKTDDI